MDDKALWIILDGKRRKVGRLVKITFPKYEDIDVTDLDHQPSVDLLPGDLRFTTDGAKGLWARIGQDVEMFARTLSADIELRCKIRKLARSNKTGLTDVTVSVSGIPRFTMREPTPQAAA